MEQSMWSDYCQKNGFQATAVAFLQEYFAALGVRGELPKEAVSVREAEKMADVTLDLGKVDGERRVIVDDEEIARARLCLVAALAITIKRALSLLGVSAPEHM